MAVSLPIDIAQIRKQFPSLECGFAFLENAGGSQVPAGVIDAMSEYMRSCYVQLGAGYEASIRATDTVDRAHAFINTFVNGDGAGQTILGPSSTQLLHMLADCYERGLEKGSEIIICQTAHEANAGPWARLLDRGFTIKAWKVDPKTFQCSLLDLEALITPKTKIVAFPHVSNLLGEIVDVKAVVELCHQHDVRTVVDGVAYAPHRAIDVADWDVDWYVYSTYKVFGPHMAALYGRQDAIEEIVGPNHFFIPKDDIYKFELGGVSHEGCAGLLALGNYLGFLSGRSDRSYETVRAAFEVMTELELPLQERLISYLLSKPSVRIIGPAHAERSRVSTISFVHDRLSSPEISKYVNERGVGIRYGHMYAYRLCKALGIDIEAGVVRVSMVHYNTIEEVEKLIGILEEIL